MKKAVSFTLALVLSLGLAVPARAAGGTAYASPQSVEVDGKAVQFQMYALRDASGNGTNYVKLRDVAHVLNGTGAQFSVGYDNASKSISVTSGQAYADVGGEMTTPYTGDRTYQTGSGSVLVDGKAVNMEAIVLTDDQGGGYTYFKLRDLGLALGFKVDWSKDRGVIVETGGAAPIVPEEPSKPGMSTKEIEVTTLDTQWGTGYYVKDNGFGDGYLNNGKPITEENVLELLDEAQKIWPTGTSWTYSGTTNNHWYEWSGRIVDSVVLRKYNESTNYACGGFASMISDYLFGLNSNPMHRVTDPMDIRAGDIIVQMDNGKPVHVGIAVSSAIKSGDFAGRVWTANGNYSDGTLKWPDYEYGVPNSEFIDQQFTPSATWEVWSRYPA